MSSLTHAIAEIKDLAAKAQLSTDQFVSAAAVLDAREEEIKASNRALPDERQTLDAWFKNIDGAINPDLSAGDICTQAGVRINRGTSNYATRAKQRLLADLRK